MKKTHFLWMALFTLVGLSIACGQRDISGIYERNQFSIYLSTQKYVPDQSVDVTLVQLEDRPFISQDDMTAYYWDKNLIQLTAQAYDKVLHTEPGFIFVACIGRKRLFWGTFCECKFINGLTATSPGATGNIALFKPNPAFMKWYKTKYGKDHGKNLIQLASRVKEGEQDPLSDTRIGDALVKADKLFTVDKPLSVEELDSGR
jgi:hypothetical protein